MTNETVSDLIRLGRLEEALARLQDDVRRQPAESRHRRGLFQLFCILGQWDRAMTQLAVLNDMDSDSSFLAKILEPVLHCEALRAEVFAGKRTPLVLGEPEEWMSFLFEANQLVAQGRFQSAAELRDKAFEAAPVTTGKLNDHAFQWIADVDVRLGPMLEVAMEGKYYWVPFSRVAKIHTEPPADLRDLVWLPAQFVWSNGGEMSGFIPVRYPQTELATDNALRLARKTEWVEREAGYQLGLGQRMLCTDEQDFPLLEIRDIDLVSA
jgi:type VI secretion system protein ImpE